LTYSSPAVQAGHCVAKFCLESKKATEWNNHTLIYLELYSKKDLYWWMYKLRKKDIEITKFVEPDMDNEITCICAYTYGEIFKNLNLLNKNGS